jgi:TPR repeat protein
MSAQQEELEMAHYSRSRHALMLAAALFSAAPALADLKAGIDALGVKDYARARAEFEAEPNNGEAIYQLSRMATTGLGEPRNDTRVANLLRRASELGHPAATVDYAYALGNGRGVPKDAAEAVRILEAAGATITLGRVLRYGFWGVAKDEVRAASLFQKAMESGDVAGTTLYAQALLEGAGVAKDEARAAQLLRQAADGGYEAAQLELARVLLRGLGVPKDEPAAVALYLKVAASGNPAAQYGLALAYANGAGVARDAAAAARWVDAAARQGHASSQFLLADWFQRGQGVPRIKSEAYFWFSLASKSTDAAFAQRASERRALMANDMQASEIARLMNKVEAFVPQPGLRPRREALPALAHGDQVKVGSATLRIPAPTGYVNGWELREWMQQAYPNDPNLRPMLLVLAQQEDTERVKLGLTGSYRFIEITSELSDQSVAATPALFGDIKKRLRNSLQAGVAAGRQRVEVVVDDEGAYAFVRSVVSQADSIEAVALVLVKQRLLAIAFLGFRPEQQDELKELARKMAADLLSSNQVGLFSQ